MDDNLVIHLTAGGVGYRTVTGKDPQRRVVLPEFPRARLT
jgi:hypothetical protein